MSVDLVKKFPNGANNPLRRRRLKNMMFFFLSALAPRGPIQVLCDMDAANQLANGTLATVNYGQPGAFVDISKLFKGKR